MTSALVPAPLTIRALPFDQWTRVQGIEPFLTKGLPDNPDTWLILVVERGERIVGTCSLFMATHWDCWWVNPEELGTARGIILRQLLREALGVLDELHVQQVYTGAQDDAPQVASMLTRYGFTEAPGQLFVLQVAEVANAVHVDLMARGEQPARRKERE